MVLELGVTGLITFATLAIAVLMSGVAFVRRRGRDLTGPASWMTIVMVAVIAALIGRSAEQMVGIARMGDLVPFWALLAVVLAIYGMDRSVGAVDKDRPDRLPIRSRYVSIGAAAILTVVLLTIFVFRDVQMLNSGLTAADAFEESAAGNSTEAITLLKEASDRSPDVQQYHVWAGELLVRKAQEESDSDVASALLHDARETFATYVERDAFAYLTQIRLGLAEVELVNRGNSAIRIDLIRRSLNTAEAMPNYPDVQALAAERLLVAGQLDLGLQLADRAIAMESESLPQPLAWFMRGNALGDLGDVDGALTSFQMSLERDPEGPFASGVHRNLALVYEGLGDAALAAEHRERALEIEAALAER